jgi:hypothetical protein
MLPTLALAVLVVWAVSRSPPVSRAPVVSAVLVAVVMQSGLVEVVVEQVVAKAGPASNAATAAESIKLCLLKCDLLRLCGLRPGTRTPGHGIVVLSAPRDLPQQPESRRDHNQFSPPDLAPVADKGKFPLFNQLLGG